MTLDYSDFIFVIASHNRLENVSSYRFETNERACEQARASIKSHHRVEFSLTTSIFLPFFLQISTELFMTWWLLILVFLYLFQFFSPSSFRYSLNALPSPVVVGREEFRSIWCFCRRAHRLAAVLLLSMSICMIWLIGNENDLSAAL